MATTKVVILNWNGQELLSRFLPSVVANTPPEVEIVVIDNGSDDDSAAMLTAVFPSVRVVTLDANYGFAGGYNRGLQELEASGAGADHYILLNSDVETPAGWYEPLIAALGRDPDVFAVSPKMLSFEDHAVFEYAGACGGFIDYLGYPFCRGRILSTIEKDSGQYDDVREVFWGSGACLAVRADLFHRLGGFDERFFAHMEEVDLCWRAQLYGYKIVVEPASQVYHLGGGTLPEKTPRKMYLNFRNSLAMLYKNLSPRSRRFVIFTRMLLDGGSAIVYLVSGRPALFRAVFKAHSDYRRMKPEIKISRKEIQSGAVARPRYIYRGSILLRYMFGWRRFGRMM